ncbi:MAG: peptide chain release factor N(5)-glutamine methyltransferase [Candidatus Cloacimonadaceae bacterium]|jgi:release factor glutamine methyltransferase|nr:peptide chain release factor N(5)-glutamine methyltransferase [Candidatus Cloacimonadota bacterium]MDX9949116.1 peptide chain release factor N(5)-glutamine methyltransferase [Candidatus Syntrophosphaera sp.]
MTLARLLQNHARPDNDPAALNWLLSGILDCSVPELALLKERELPPQQENDIINALRRLNSDEPPQYILGKTWFWGLELRLDTRVLIPRPETEGLVELALSLSQPGARVLDLGTGSGAIAITLKKMRPDLAVTAIDISSGALQVARENAALNDVQIIFEQNDIFPSAPGVFDLIISNPPYVSQAEHEALPRSLRGFEPSVALLAGADGLGLFRRIFAGLKERLAPAGIALFEHGHTQRESLLALGKAAGLDCLLAKEDLAGKDRYLAFKLSKPVTNKI